MKASRDSAERISRRTLVLVAVFVAGVAASVLIRTDRIEVGGTGRRMYALLDPGSKDVQLVQALPTGGAAAPIARIRIDDGQVHERMPVPLLAPLRRTDWILASVWPSSHSVLNARQRVEIDRQLLAMHVGSSVVPIAAGSDPAATLLARHSMLPWNIAYNIAVIVAVVSGVMLVFRVGRGVGGALRERSRSSRGQCLACGYAVGELPRCPECGEARSTPAE